MKKFLFFFVSMFFAAGIAFAEDIGAVKTTGLFLKDTLSVRAADDPDYPWVTCYTTDIEIGGPNFENPTDSSIACRLIGSAPGNVAYKNGSRVFKNSKNPFFKTMYVDRFYDARRNVLVYISYVRKFSGENASHSLSVVPLGRPLTPARN